MTASGPLKGVLAYTDEPLVSIDLNHDAASSIAKALRLPDNVHELSAKKSETFALEEAGIAVHGDFTPWNLLFQNGKLSGILDFELARRDHRIADFALAWRGQYDDVIHAYFEVAPISAEEWALLTPLWWAQLIEGACRNIRAGVRDDGWTLKMLMRRSKLMGDASSIDQ